MKTDKIKNGDIININQTVNGCDTFIVVDLKDVRYYFDLNRKYEYDVDELLSIEDIDILDNIYELIDDIKHERRNNLN